MVDHAFNAALEKMKTDVNDAAWNGGSHCPVCNQLVKVYRRGISSTMAVQLICAYQLGGTSEYVHVSAVSDKSGFYGVSDFSKLKLWGFIEEMPHTAGDDGKKTSGSWKVTPAGADFIQGNTTCFAAAFICNNVVLEWDRTELTITDCLGKRFDYSELMKAAA